MFFEPAPEHAAPIRMAPGLAFVAAVSLFMVFAIGLYAAPFIELANSAAEAVLPVVDAMAHVAE